MKVADVVSQSVIKFSDSAALAGAINYDHNTDKLHFITNGTAVPASGTLNIDSDGNVGIGTVSPNATLEVYKKFDGLADTTAVTLGGDDSGMGFCGIKVTSKDDQSLDSPGTQTLSVINDDTADFVVAGDGNAGIGTASPANNLVIKGSSNTSSHSSDDPPYMVIENTFNEYLKNKIFGGIAFSKTGVSSNVNGSLSNGIRAGLVAFYDEDYNFSGSQVAGNVGMGLNFRTSVQNVGDSETRMTITGSGNVGIGTESPSSPLTIGSNNTANYGYMALENSYADSKDGTNLGAIFFKGRQPDDSLETGVAIRARGAGNADNLSNNLPGELLFQTNPGGTGGLVDRMLIDKDGNVGINAHNPGSRLEVAEDPISNGNDLLPKKVLTLMRPDVSGVTYAQRANFFLRKYEGDNTSGISTQARTQLDIALAHSNGENGEVSNIDGSNERVGGTAVLSLRSDGFITIGGSLGVGTTPQEKFHVNGTVKLDDTPAPTTTTNKLYSTGGKLYWNGSELAAGSSSNFAAASHTHGNISNDGKVGAAANRPLITTTAGAVTTGVFGTSANSFCQGNDSRLSDARTPTSHSHTLSDISDLTLVSENANNTTLFLGGNTSGNTAARNVVNGGLESVGANIQITMNNANFNPGFRLRNELASNTAHKEIDLQLVKNGDFVITAPKKSTGTTDLLRIANDGKIVISITPPAFDNNLGANTIFHEKGFLRIKGIDDNASLGGGGSSNVDAINDLSDVNITSLSDNDILYYDSSSSKWINDAPTEPAFISDKKYKTEIFPISEALSKVNFIKGANFTWSDDAPSDLGGKKDVGVIAQDVQKVLPEAVEEKENGDLTVKYHRIIPLLIESIKELSEENKALKSRLDKIEGTS